MLKITQYRSWEELQVLRDAWNPLLSQSGSDTVFLTWQWCEAWWKNYGGSQDLFVLAGWDGRELVGVAPFYLGSQQLGGKNWKCLRLIGDGTHDSDYLDCFMQQGRETEIAANFAQSLEAQRESWDWLEWNGAHQNSSAVSAFMQCVGERRWWFTTELVRSTTLPLPTRWDVYLKLLEPRFRTKVRSSLALLDENLKSVPVKCHSVSQLDEWLAMLFELHTKRWGTRSEPGVFRGSAKRKFYSDLSRSALEQGWLSFHRLNWGERALALQYGLIYRNRFHLLQEGYDPDYSGIRPGQALRAWLMRHFVDSGLKEYDFLAGASSYKLDWGGQEKMVTRLLVSPSRTGKLIAIDLPQFRRSAKERIGQLAPDSLRSLRRKLIAGRRSRQDVSSGPVRAERHGLSEIRQWLPAAVYSSTPLGQMGRSLASTYTWNRKKTNYWLPLKRRTRPVVHIFRYHRVNDEGDPFLGGLPVDSFREQMRYLAATFPFLTLDQIAEGDLSAQHPYYVAVTFDDGYRDNFICAFPILKQLGIPAAVFLVSGNIESGQLTWYDQVRLAFKLTTKSRFSMAQVGGPGGSLIGLRNRLHYLDQTLGWLRRTLEAQRRIALTELFHELNVPADLSLPNQMLRWEDVRQMSKHQVSFGGHTVSHPVLSKISASDLREEIVGSKQMIEHRLQRAISHFAYPFGQPADFGAQAKQTVKDAGYKTAVTTVWGLNEQCSDLFELRRFTPWESSPAEFRLRLDWYRMRELQPADQQEAG